MKALRLILFTISLIVSTVAYSQLEIIPLCLSKDVYTYTKQLDDTLHLFSNIKGFQKAKFLKQNDSLYFALIYYQREGQLYVTKRKISPSLLNEIRKKIKNLYHPGQQLKQSKFYKNGKLRFNLGNSFYSLFGYAWMIPTAAKFCDELWIGTYLTSGAVGIFVPMWLTSKSNISVAEAIYKNYGQFKGFGDGIMLYSFVDKKLINKTATWASSISFSILEGTAGYLIAKKAKFTYLNALTSENYSLYGYYLGATLGMLWMKKYNFYACRLPAIVANYAGALGGYLLSKNINFTHGDNRILFGTAFLANTWAAAINTIPYQDLSTMLNFDSVGISPLYFGAASLGILTGTYLGIKNNFTASQAVITNLSTIGSELISTGLIYIFTKSNDYNIIIKRSLWASSIIGTATFSLLYANYAKQNKLRDFTSTSSQYNINLSFSPYTLLAKNKFTTKNLFAYEPIFSLYINF